MTINIQDLYKMNKSNLIGLIIKMDQEKNATPVKAAGRKEQVLTCLRNGVNSIDKIADQLGINNKNVSSQLTYLRKDGYMIYSIRINNVTTLKLDETGEMGN